MADIKMFVVICAAILSVFGADHVVPPQPGPSNNGTTEGPPTTPSPAPTTASPNVTTTVSPNVTTTLSPNVTTTASPNVTTTITTTTIKPPTTPSTPSPPTTKPTPTSKPTPAPAPVDPKVANWTVNYENSNRSCIVLEAAIQFEILDTNSSVLYTVNVPVDAKASGSCGDNATENMTVTWGQNKMEFEFVKLNTSKFELGALSTTLNVTAQGSKVYNLVHTKPEFSTPSANSYKCARVQSLNLTEDNSNVTVAYLHISHLQYQAFSNVTEHKFDSAMDCEGSITPDIVPIVVGCVLAALVVMVLIAYLVGRRRCQARGYLSMFAETKSEEDYIPMKNLSSCFK